MGNMKKTSYVLVLMVIVILAAVPLLAGCGDDDDEGNNNGESTQKPQTTEAGFELSGTIDEAGSTSVQPLAEVMATQFEMIHPKVRVNVAGGGSSAGVRACANGTVDLGAASRDVKISETDVIPYAIARDVVAIVVHPDNPISELSTEQAIGIYEGDIDNWSEVGGSDDRIVVVSREEGSGTREVFTDNITEDIKGDTLFFDSNGAVKSKVESESNAIGYLSLGYVVNLKTIKLDGVGPDEDAYTVARRLYVLTRDEAEGPVAAFIQFCRSKEGQALAEAEGYKPLKLDTKAYEMPDFDAEISGSIDIAGSTSVQPLAEAMAAEFEKEHGGVTISISGGGSSAGVRSCAQGTVDVGAASRDIKLSENDLIPHAIARDVVAIAVHPDNPVSELSTEQVSDIYEGEITNWSEVGGNDERIVVVSREEGSGTREVFTINITEDIKGDALFFDSNGAVKSKVESEKNAIGYLSLGYVGNLKTIELDGSGPDESSYPVARRLYLLTQDVPTGEVKAFLDFCRADEGQAIAEAEGYKPLMK
ncbi:extracellular solute-binding protein [Candidatus Uhrbacteria bacterium]|nr:extracellular solute-binding protein [Candidatus Uhrbacteria bacterium]